MTKEYIRPSWIYRIWSFTATHNQLILRSDFCTDDGGILRAEVYFGNVAFLSMTSVHRGIFLRKTPLDRSRTLISSLGLRDEETDRVFTVDEAGSQFIISSSPEWREAPRDIDDMSLFDFDQPWPLPTDIARDNLSLDPPMKVGVDRHIK